MSLLVHYTTEGKEAYWQSNETNEANSRKRRTGWVTLQETTGLPCALCRARGKERGFAVCLTKNTWHKSGTRQTTALPCAGVMAHDKQQFCHVPDSWHTGNRLFVMCQAMDTRLRLSRATHTRRPLPDGYSCHRYDLCLIETAITSFLCVRREAHVKGVNSRPRQAEAIACAWHVTTFVVCPEPGTRQRVGLYRVPHVCTWQRYHLRAIQQSLCRVYDILHMKKPALPIAFLSCLLCRGRLPTKALQWAFWP